MRRAAHAFLVALIAAGAAAAIALVALAVLDEDFSSSAWRTARAEEDHERLEDLARTAVDGEELLGRSPAEVQEMLGAPDRRGRRRRLWTWHLLLNSYLGPGDGGALYVEFSGAPPRVRTAEVGSMPAAR